MPSFRLPILVFACTLLLVPRLSAQSQGGQTRPQAAQAAPRPAVRTPLRLLTLGVGPAAYRGDLSAGYRKWASAVHVGLKFNRRRRFNGHLNLALGTLTGQNAAYAFTGPSEAPPMPNRYFKTSFFSVQYEVQFNLLKTSRWMVYLSQGVGVMRFNPKDEYGGAYQDQLATRPATETYGNIALVLPTQAGAWYLLPNGYGAGLQAGWLHPLTDYLDNIGQWGNRAGRDNALWLRIQVAAPLVFSE